MKIDEKRLLELGPAELRNIQTILDSERIEVQRQEKLVSDRLAELEQEALLRRPPNPLGVKTIGG